MSLLLKSKKPGLDQGRVEHMLKLIERRFGNDWDLRTLSQKVNQKCHDMITITSYTNHKQNNV